MLDRLLVEDLAELLARLEALQVRLEELLQEQDSSHVMLVSLELLMQDLWAKEQEALATELETQLQEQDNSRATLALQAL